MEIGHGRLLRLTNRSGHYAPPPSCLNVAMARLRGMGLAHLDRVSLELVSPPAMLVQNEEEPQDEAEAAVPGLCRR